MNGFREKLESGAFVVTAEIGPPKGVDVEEMLGKAGLVAPWVDGVNVTDNQSATMHMSPVVAGHLIRNAGAEPIVQLTCRDRNRLALQSELLGAAALGMKNVLCLTGDHVRFGDHKGAKAVFDIDSVQLLEVIRELNDGRDMSGNPLHGAPDFYAGAVATPQANPVEPQMIKLEKKVRSGAAFIQTQGVYDLAPFRAFAERADAIGAKILAGIILLASGRMARFMNDNIPGVEVPESAIARLEAVPADKMLDVGMEIAAESIAALRDEPHCHGVHIMAINREELVPAILERAGLEPLVVAGAE